MNLRCRLFGHTFNLEIIPGSDEAWLNCKHCMAHAMVCKICNLIGYIEGIGGREIPCPNGPHKVTAIAGKRKTSNPRGRIVIEDTWG